MCELPPSACSFILFVLRPLGHVLAVEGNYLAMLMSELPKELGVEEVLAQARDELMENQGSDDEDGPEGEDAGKESDGNDRVRGHALLSRVISERIRWSVLPWTTHYSALVVFLAGGAADVTSMSALSTLG